MDLAFNAEELAFQKEVRDWITAVVAKKAAVSRPSSPGVRPRSIIATA